MAEQPLYSDDFDLEPSDGNPLTVKTNRWAFVNFDNPEQWQLPEKGVAFASWQLEKCPKTGRLHIQGYVRFKVRKIGSYVQRWITANSKQHIIPARGNEEQNYVYTQKERTRVAGPWQFGDYDPKSGISGRRTDLEAVTAMIIKEAPPLKRIAMEFPTTFVHFHKGLSLLRETTRPDPPLQRDVKVQVLWGRTDQGKSHRVNTLYPTAYRVGTGRDPFGMYDGEDVIFMEEFTDKLFSISLLNQYLDKWPVQIDCRYYNKHARWTKVFIVSQFNPLEWYPLENPQARAALFRRITPNMVEVVSREQEITMI